jgi:hypothetical protein
MDEDITSDLVIAEEMPLSKSPEPTILSTDHQTEEINNSSNLIKNDTLTTTKIQADQMQLKTYAGDSADPYVLIPLSMIQKLSTEEIIRQLNQFKNLDPTI